MVSRTNTSRSARTRRRQRMAEGGSVDGCMLRKRPELTLSVHAIGTASVTIVSHPPAPALSHAVAAFVGMEPAR